MSAKQAFYYQQLAAKMSKSKLLLRIFSISPPIENKNLTDVCKIGSNKKNEKHIKCLVEASKLQLLRQITDDFQKSKTDENKAVKKCFFLVYVCKVRKRQCKFIDICSVFLHVKTGVYINIREIWTPKTALCIRLRELSTF